MAKIIQPPGPLRFQPSIFTEDEARRLYEELLNSPPPLIGRLSRPSFRCAECGWVIERCQCD